MSNKIDCAFYTAGLGGGVKPDGELSQPSQVCCRPSRTILGLSANRSGICPNSGTNLSWLTPIVYFACLSILAALFSPSNSNGQDEPSHPNIILIMTDDQGIGDLGVMGNPIIETPNIDKLASQSAWLTNFYVQPVCAPTRACLMTGRYNYRTRAIDTYIGRAMMEPEEITIAEVLSMSGYATGIFGKWHLGDCYPMRAMDQGFQTSVVHRGGGIGQPSDALAAPRQYTNPILFRNGIVEQFKGYCTDIYYDEAIRFIDESQRKAKPFFVYLPDNCPHGPFHDVPQGFYEKYKSKNLSADQFPQQQGHPIPETQNADTLARIFAMISNVDRNVGRVLRHLDELKIADNTIVIFMCDNGPNTQRYVKGMRGRKGQVYEGGIRSPFFIRWPARIKAGLRIDKIAAHIDVMPTLLGACGIGAAKNLDGLDFSAILQGELRDWPARNIVIQSHRGNQPTRLHHFAVRNPRWKLVHNSGFGKEKFEGAPKIELYDMFVDPLEMNNVASDNPEVVRSLRDAYDKWFDDVSATRADNYAPPRIVIGSEHENPTTLTRQDWRRTAGGGWGAGGHWLVTVNKPKKFTIRCQLLRKQPRESVEMRIGDHKFRIETDDTNLTCEFRDIELSKGDYQISAIATGGGEKQSVYQVEISH